MNKGTILYGVALIIMIGVVIASYEKPQNWTKSYSRYDKNPYGSYALHQLMPDLFYGKSFKGTNLTLYETLNGEDSAANLLSISQQFVPDQPSLDFLLEKTAEGQSMFISANYFSDFLEDTLGFHIYTQNAPINYPSQNTDSSFVYFPEGDSVEYIHTELLVYIDTLPEDADTLLLNEFQNPVAVSIPFGRGKIIINTTPILFTNYFLLHEDNSEMVSRLLSSLPQEDLVWTEYYQNGKFISQSPFREILKYKSLKNALYLAIVLLIIYLLLGVKRVQRAIPVVRNLPNQTLDFVKTVGALYFHSQEHKTVAENRINYFKEYVRLRFGIALHLDDSSILAAKSGMNSDIIDPLLNSIKTIELQSKITADILVTLDKNLDRFYRLSRHS